MSSGIYPSFVAQDFDDELIAQAAGILTQPMEKLGPILEKLLNESAKELLLCILRILIESKFTDNTAAILGWFVINKLIPTPTQYCLFSNILQYRKTLEGLHSVIVFTRAILPHIYKYPMFCKVLANTPQLRFLDSDLFLLLTQIYDGEAITFENHDTKSHFILPEKRKKFIPIQISPPPPDVTIDSNTSPRQNLFGSIDFAQNLTGESQRQFLIQVCLKFKPPTTQIDNLPLLQAACDYLKLLLTSVRGIGWTYYTALPWIAHMGSWIGALSIDYGRPPPLYMLDIIRILKESAQTGSFGAAMFFTLKYFSKASSIYNPPCPYTCACMEIMAAMLHVKGLRTDICNMIYSFANRFKVDIENYYRRDIDIPIDSFDRQFVFVQEAEGNVFTKQTADKSATFTQEDLEIFFSYKPKFSSITDDLKDLALKAQEMEKYYFLGSGTDIIQFSNDKINDLNTIQSIVSLAMSDTTIVSSTFLKILTKMTQNKQNLDLSGLFRVIFPHPSFFKFVVSHGYYNLATLNSLFSDLLTNPATAEMIQPTISRYIAMLPHADKAMLSCYSLLGVTSPQGCTANIPLFDKPYISIVSNFLTMVKEQTESSKMTFIQSFKEANAQQITTILLALVNCFIKQRKIDYSLISFLANVLSRHTSQISPDSLITNTKTALESLEYNIYSVKEFSLTLYKFLDEYLSQVQLKQRDRLIYILEYLSPKHCPGFACCWIQLCLHATAFPSFVRRNDTKFSSFCFNFIITLQWLASYYPDGFYRPILRCLHLICNDYPLFISSYYMPLIEHLPPHYIQIRNLILSCSPPDSNSASKQPNISFNIEESLDQKGLTSVVKQFIRREHHNKEQFEDGCHAILSALTDASQRQTLSVRLYWQLVLNSITRVTGSIWTEDMVSGTTDFKELPIVKLFLKLFSSLNETGLKMLTFSLIDLLRFPSSHTSFAGELIYFIFENSNDVVCEIIYTELAKRLLCVTSPPRSVKALYLRLMSTFKSDISELFRKGGEKKYFIQTKKALDCLN
ncbi:hypothetical protein TVAG_157830 [Trichomonas vaginalis G3]|uniref:CCR4-Not complex component Not1 C-terminal domain-containing protein n=1 Tax=Trichomonas vaginalis (strain ATCC PRA-98 / G3) TaxID=412133 RepID=A2FBB8_TRIV3|nr:nuclear-transcribed mRNA catabolic process, deadenylation-dependent decay [Trichomonas vaginalis G3]EAX97798.1 hypothetical protein TVAG_157830 [Trichomonas vaginalis G3]KAI5552726.1 nuclear-transcribed mRNA catabolic process, deadenylation-dependent decay [Trichomonas vaginalis G3]|eukprot:XP_001310728.1 hypothetical protein [Trichomonas vaginalis G3]